MPDVREALVQLLAEHVDCSVVYDRTCACGAQHPDGYAAHLAEVIESTCLVVPRTNSSEIPNGSRDLIAEGRAFVDAAAQTHSVEIFVREGLEVYEGMLRTAPKLVDALLDALEARRTQHAETLGLLEHAYEVIEAAQRPPLAAMPSPAEFRRYLEVRGWSPASSGRYGTVWAKGGARIAVPRELDDQLARGVLDRLARAERRGVEAVVAEVREAQP